MQKIVLFGTEDQVDLSIEEALVGDGEFSLTLCNGRSDEELPVICADADAIVTIYAKVDGAALAKMPRCKIVAQQAIGFDNVDLAAASELGICVSNVPNFCSYDVAMHSVTMALACARRMVELDRRVRSGTWGYEGFVMHRVCGQRFGMVGFGSIPQQMVPMLKAFGIEIAVFDPRVPDDLLAQHGASRVTSLEELLRSCDFISLHCPLNKDTYGLIGARELAQMKPSAFLINSARGGIVDEAALLEALRTGKIAGAALDVLEREQDGENPLYAMDNLIVTPHTAFYSEEAVETVRRRAMEQVLTVLRDRRRPEHLLNQEVLEHARFLKD